MVPDNTVPAGVSFGPHKGKYALHCTPNGGGWTWLLDKPFSGAFTLLVVAIAEASAADTFFSLGAGTGTNQNHKLAHTSSDLWSLSVRKDGDVSVGNRSVTCAIDEWHACVGSADYSASSIQVCNSEGEISTLSGTDWSADPWTYDRVGCNVMYTSSRNQGNSGAFAVGVIWEDRKITPELLSLAKDPYQFLVPA